MKTSMTLITMLLVMTCNFAMASTGAIDVQVATNLENSLHLTITGPAAEEISAQLLQNGIPFKREGFSGASVQYGKGIRCIAQYRNNPLYCSITLVGSEVQ